jgi:hypothetical protein
MSAPPDPKARAAADDEAAAAEAEAEAEAAAAAPERASSIEALRAQGDVDGLIHLAKAYRAGTAGLARDLKKCFEAYSAAAELGNPLALHALGLFHLHGGPVPPDEKEAATRFRAAADAGHLAGKVYVANFYELGIHYRADPAKSDVWYRNVARSAGIEAEPGTPEHDRVLADLGCVRHALKIAEDPKTSEADRTKLLRIAKIHGHREGRASMTPEMMADAELDAVDREAESAPQKAGPLAAVAATADARAAADKATPRARKSTAPAEKTEVKVERPSRISTPKAHVGLGLTAFFFSLVCMAVAAVAGHVAPPFLAERALPIPVLGMRFDLVLPVALVVIGGLPNLLVYRVAAWLRAAALALAAGVAGEVLWGLGRHFAPSHVIQVADLAAAGFLAGLLVFGIFGGAKPGSK